MKNCMENEAIFNIKPKEIIKKTKINKIPL
jgi:hypothetical protein